MNGFFKIIRGVNNLAIESDCAFVEPDVTEEELVWEETPAYGGSIFGIVPFSDSAKNHPVRDTQDITHANLSEKSSEPAVVLVSSNQSKHDVSVLNSVLYFIAGCVFSFAATAIVNKKFGRRYTYRAIN
jgi:cathepsin X